MAFQMDADDDDEDDDEEPDLSGCSAERESSLVRGYDALGADLHWLGGSSGGASRSASRSQSPWPSSRADLPKRLPSADRFAAGAVRRQSVGACRDVSAMVLDLGDEAESRRTPTGLPSTLLPWIPSEPLGRRRTLTRGFDVTGAMVGPLMPPKPKARGRFGRGPLDETAGCMRVATLHPLAMHGQKCLIPPLPKAAPAGRDARTQSLPPLRHVISH